MLQRTRDEVLSYLVWLFNDMVQGEGLLHVRREIMRAANRLAEIAAHWPEALSRHLDQCLADEPDWPGHGGPDTLRPGPGK